MYRYKYRIDTILYVEETISKEEPFTKLQI